MLEALNRLLGTASWRKREATRLAGESFSAYDQKSSALVLECLVYMLGVSFEQLRPDTDLANDLAADEDEPWQFCLWFREETGIELTTEQIVEAMTVGGMISLVSASMAKSDSEMKTDGD